MLGLKSALASNKKSCQIYLQIIVQFVLLKQYIKAPSNLDSVESDLKYNVI